MKSKAIIPFLLVMFICGCGKKGPLVLEPENPFPAVERLLVRQIGAQIELAWRFPGSPADPKEVFEAGEVSRVHVYHASLKPGEEPALEVFLKKAALLAKPKATEIAGLGRGSPSYRLQFKNKDLQGKIHGFALVYFYGRKRSLPSPLRIIGTQVTPPPIHDLQISRQEKTVILNWSRPAGPDKERPTWPISRYQVYRRIGVGGPDAVFRAIGSQKTVNENFHDSDTGTDGEYEYQVSSCLDERIESAPSNTVRIKILDTFPPDVPLNLVLFTAKDQIFLTWEAVPDPDLAFYRLYRKNSENEDFKLLA
ncbi:MAG TPA: hypothetical protein VLQ89_07450, partial [Candidatus Binatia bacterium]|nr:hypothetical protein [Candidatus Binatia bacterium]